MLAKRSWWLAAICSLLLTGCKDCKFGGAPGQWGTSPNPAAKGLNVFNCSPYNLGVFWVAGTIPNWSQAEGEVLSVAMNCGQALYIPFEDGVEYTVRYRKDFANCAAGGESNEFEPTDCTPHGDDATFTGDANGDDLTWEVE